MRIVLSTCPFFVVFTLPGRPPARLEKVQKIVLLTLKIIKITLFESQILTYNLILMDIYQNFTKIAETTFFKVKNEILQFVYQAFSQNSLKSGHFDAKNNALKNSEQLH